MKKFFFCITCAALLSGFTSAGAMEADLLKGVQIHGFISQGFLLSDEYNYLADDSEDGSFEYNEMGINFSKELTDKLRIGLQFFSRDLGDASNNEITVDWAYGDYRWQDWLGLQAGRIKVPLGLYNEARDMDMLRTSIVMPQGIYSDLTRDTIIALNGIGAYGNIDMGGAGSLGYQLLAGSLTIDNESGMEKYFNSQLRGGGTVAGDFDTDTSYCGALRWNTPLQGLRLGYSVFAVDSAIPLELTGRLGGGQAELDEELTAHIFSSEYTTENLVLAFEYLLLDTDRMLRSMDLDNTAESYYLSASYRFTDLFALGTYYSITHPNRDDRDGDELTAQGLPDHLAWQHDLALTLRFDINDYWVVKVEGHRVDGTALVLSADNDEILEEDWYYGAAKVTFSF